MLTYPVESYMSSPVVSITGDISLAAAERVMERAGVSSVPVLDPAGKPAGVLSRTDLMRVGRPTGAGHPAIDLPALPVFKAMTRGVLTVPAGTTIGETARYMVDGRIHRVYVETDEGLAGVVSTRDVMRAVADARIMQPISAVMSKRVHTVPASAALGTAVSLLGTLGISGLVVVEGDRPLGVLSQADVLSARDRPPDTPVGKAMGSWHLSMPASTPLWQAAARAGQLKVRHILATVDGALAGILTGIDLAGAALLAPPS